MKGYQVGNYMIVPSGTKLDYEVYQFKKVYPRNGGEPREEWVGMRKYPPTFGRALFEVFEYMVHDLEEGEVVEGVKAIRERVEQIYKKLVTVEGKGLGDGKK